MDFPCMKSRRRLLVRAGAASLLALITVAALGMAAVSAAQGDTTRVSLDSAGDEANGHSFTGTVSADGRRVAFASDASDLVPGDTNGVRDVFVRDRQTGDTIMVSVHSDGTQGTDTSEAPTLSADGWHRGLLVLRSRSRRRRHQRRV
jgi:Tol biopolymer transport system component